MANPNNIPGLLLMRAVNVGGLRWWVNPIYTNPCKADMTPEQLDIFQKVTDRLSEINDELSLMSSKLAETGLYVRVSLESEYSGEEYNAFPV